MSYCRFSSDDWASDVYVYESGSGLWVTRVAGNRTTGDIPKTPPLTTETVDAYVAAHRVQMAYLRSAPREPITLPYAGTALSDYTPGACADRLEHLRALGYHVPQYALDRLRAEAAQGSE